MAVKIVTNEGTVAFTPPNEKVPTWEDEDAAKARCKKANDAAKAMGLKVKYEVVPAK